MVWVERKTLRHFVITKNKYAGVISGDVDNGRYNPVGLVQIPLWDKCAIIVPGSVPIHLSKNVVFFRFTGSSNTLGSKKDRIFKLVIKIRWENDRMTNREIPHIRGTVAHQSADKDTHRHKRGIFCYIQLTWRWGSSRARKGPWTFNWNSDSIWPWLLAAWHR